jgi:hypothetical protein
MFVGVTKEKLLKITVGRESISGWLNGRADAGNAASSESVRQCFRAGYLCAPPVLLPFLDIAYQHLAVYGGVTNRKARLFDLDLDSWRRNGGRGLAELSIDPPDARGRHLVRMLTCAA